MRPPLVAARAKRPALSVPAPAQVSLGRRPAAARGPAEMVRQRSLLGNAAMTAVMNGPPELAPTSWAGQMMLAGQNMVGNQAVAAGAVATPVEGPKKPEPPKLAPAETRAKTGPQPRKPEVKDQKGKPEGPDKPDKTEAGAARSPAGDPKFQALKKDVNAKKRKIGKSHPPATAEAGAAQAAAKAPADDREARGKADHAEEMERAEAKDFDKKAFIEAVKKAIEDRSPKNLEQADEFGESGKAEEVKTEVQGKVGDGKDASAKQIADTTAETPQPAPDAKQVVPMAPDQVPGKPGAPNPNQAAPDVLPPEATDMSAGPAQVNGQMAAAQVTEKQLSLENSREPSFGKAVEDKKQMEEHSAEAPGELRKGEAKEIKQVKNTAVAKGSAAMTGMHATRVGTGQKVGAGKEGAKGRDEEKRIQVTAILQKVFDKTKLDVENILSDLDKEVDRQFTDGEKKARDRFTREHTDGMRRYKAERYGGWDGGFLWAKDKLFDLPEEANRIYEDAKKNYLAAMDLLITEIANTVERELKRATERIKTGRTDLKDALDKLPKDLQEIGKEAATDFEGKFDELKDTVSDKGSALVDTLATKYTDAVKSVDEEIAKEKEKNKGLVTKAAEAIGDVIETIKELGRMLMNILRKAASAIGLILKDPIGFLDRLISGVGGGLKLFGKNAGKHLQQGVLAWLLGSGATAGMAAPTTFDILGILVMIAALLGISWPSIRAKLVRRVPDKAVVAAETAIPLVAATKTQGARGMWPDLRGRVGDLKKDLISNLVSYLLPTIILAGITWIISLFNPASAFIRACKMIIDIVRFIVTNARLIIDFVNAVLDAIIAIARGGGGVPALIEKALARSIPVLIGALAALLGVGGIPGKVKQIFQKIARPVKRAIDAVIKKITDLIKKLWAKIKPKPKKPKKPTKEDPESTGKRPPAARPRPTRKPDKKRPADRTPRRPRKDPHHRKPRKRPDRTKDRPSKKDEKRSLDAAVRAATRLLFEDAATEQSVERGLPSIKVRYRLTRIRLVREANDVYSIEVVINPRRRTKPRKFEGLFPYKIGRADQPVRITLLPKVIDTIRPIRIPMRGRDPVTGFVINMPATPNEVRPNTAARYLNEAWTGVGADNVAAAQTAVVIGVNTFEHLDPADDREATTRVGHALQRLKRPKHLLLAAFGFVWTPRWQHTKQNRDASLDEVRRVYLNLTSADKRQALTRNERRWREDMKLPYGLFREVPTLSDHTQRAVEALSKVNQQVYVVSQDPDTAVTTESGKGFLLVYDEFLGDVENDPVLIIGGYHFEGFDWGPNADPRVVQLTLLANRLDRAMREAIGKVHPEVLYPTEQAMLFKVWDRNTSRRIPLIFQDAQVLAMLRANAGTLWGVGPPEGRHIGEFMKHRHGEPAVYLPRAGVSTSALPEDLGRGYTITEEMVREYAEGRSRFGDLPPHPMYAIIMQTQAVLGAFKLAQAFLQTHRISPATRDLLRDRIFSQVVEVAKLMAADPNLTVHSKKIQDRLRRLDSMVRDLLEKVPAGDDGTLEEVYAKAQRVAQEMIKAMTGEELKGVWRELSKLLKNIRREQRRADAGPR